MKQGKSSIKAWPVSERPREILLDRGPEYISDAGLIAILLRTGIRGKDAVALARELISQFGGLRGLLNATKSDLMKVPGLGNAKIAQLSAVFEIAKRLLKEDIVGKDAIENSKDVIEYLKVSLQDLKEECFLVLFLTKGNAVLAIEGLGKGTIDQAVVFPREVVRRGIELKASAVILVHNHPGGSLKPSKLDGDLTDKITSACATVDIAVLDHLVITSSGYISIK